MSPDHTINFLMTEFNISKIAESDLMSYIVVTMSVIATVTFIQFYKHKENDFWETQKTLFNLFGKYRNVGQNRPHHKPPLQDATNYRVFLSSNITSNDTTINIYYCFSFVCNINVGSQETTTISVSFLHWLLTGRVEPPALSVAAVIVCSLKLKADSDMRGVRGCHLIRLLSHDVTSHLTCTTQALTRVCTTFSSLWHVETYIRWQKSS